MDFSGVASVFRCARCERRKEVKDHPVDGSLPECGEYVSPTRHEFPDGSWVMVGEGYTPHGVMVDTGERIRLGHPFASPSVRERARLVEDELDPAAGRSDPSGRRVTRGIPFAAPQSLDDRLAEVKFGKDPRGVDS